MGAVIAIDDLPEEARATLARRAVAAGMSVADYARRVLADAATRPTFDELLARIESRGRVRLAEPNEATVRRLRDATD